MSKIVDGLYTYDNIESALLLLDEDKYVTMDLLSVYYVISKRILPEDEFKQFVSKSLVSIEPVEFSPLNIQQIKEYIRHEYVRFSGQDHNQFNLDALMQMFDHCEIYAQRYDINIDATSINIFIYRTPSLTDFNAAKAAVIQILKLFQKKIDNPEDMITLAGVNFMVRGNSRFIDIEIDGIHSRAWVGFDMR